MDELSALLHLQKEYDFTFVYFAAEASTIRIMADLEFPAVGMDGVRFISNEFYFEVHQKRKRKAEAFFPSDSHVPPAIEALLQAGGKKSRSSQPPFFRRVLGLELFSRSMTFQHPPGSFTPGADQVRAVLKAATGHLHQRLLPQGEESLGLSETRSGALLELSPRKKFSIKSIEGEVREQEVRALDPGKYDLISSHRLSGRATGRIVFVRDALDEIFRHVGWGQKTRANVVEQGGVYIGSPCILPGGKRCGYVKAAIPAPDTAGTSTYVEFTHRTWAYFLTSLQAKKDSGEYRQDDVILGWYHTHPNSLDVFMSGVDLRTQRAQFYRPWNSAIVINPHRQLIAGFFGGNAEPAQVLLET